MISVLRQFVAPRTLAVERARGVDAAAAAAQAGGAVALVDVHANLGTVQENRCKGNLCVAIIWEY